MTTTARRFWSRQTLMEAGLPALTVLFGLQTMRVLIPSIVYAYGVQPGVTSIHMGIYAFGVFSAAFLAAALRRLLGPRASLAITAGGVALLRLAEQLSLAPLVDLALASLETALFTMFLPIYLGHVRSSEAAGRYALGLLLGLALDTGLHGVFGTYDLSWQLGIGPVLLVLLLVLIQLALLARTLAEGVPSEMSDAGFLAALPFLALGPFFFLQALLFQNVAQATVLTGWAQPAAFAWIVLANVAGVLAGVAVVSEAPRVRWFDALLVGVALGVALLFLGQGGWAGAIWLLVGQICAAGELALILTGLGARAEGRGLWRTAVANGLGMFLFVLLIFAYYIGYDLKVPYENGVLPPIAAAILVLCAVGATRLLPQARRSAPDWTPVWMALVILLLPLVSRVTWRVPQPAAGRGWPVRVMTYNLHQGFDTEGRLGMEALAGVIEESGAEVVALQEVSRGWYINASLDMLTWLSRRLNMPYVFGPTADPLWGNAILSRYPVLEHGNVPLPRGGTPLKRGFLWARIDLGGGETMLMIATHLHHVEEEGHVRLLQVPAVLDFWAGRDRTVILGDMNAKPHTPEMAMCRDAGLRDAFAEVGTGSGYTFISSGPYMRIDYLWVSPDLEVDDLLIPQSTASDHLGVVVTVSR